MTNPMQLDRRLRQASPPTPLPHGPQPTPFSHLHRSAHYNVLRLRNKPTQPATKQPPQLAIEVAQSNCNNPPTPTTDQLSQPITAVKRFTTSQWLQRYSHATNHVTVVHKTVTPQWSTQHVATRCLHTIPNTVSRAQQRLTQLYTQRCTQQSQLESKSAISYSSYGIIDTVNEGAERRHIRQPVTAHARQRQPPPFNHSPHRNQRPPPASSQAESPKWQQGDNASTTAQHSG